MDQDPNIPPQPQLHLIRSHLKPFGIREYMVRKRLTEVRWIGTLEKRRMEMRRRTS
jgi:hypothetical protein